MHVKVAGLGRNCNKIVSLEPQNKSYPNSKIQAPERTEGLRRHARGSQTGAARGDPETISCKLHPSFACLWDFEVWSLALELQGLGFGVQGVWSRA